MIDDKYLRILAAIYYLSHESPTRSSFMSSRVEAILGIGYEESVPAIRYLESAGLLTAQWGGSHRALLALTATGTDYIERPLDALRAAERPLTQTNTINVAGNFNAIDSTIVQMNAGAISDSDMRVALEDFDRVVQQLPPDTVATSQDLLQNRDLLATKLTAGDRLGAAGILSSLAKVVTVVKDSAVLIQTLPIIYNGIRLLFHLS